MRSRPTAAPLSRVRHALSPCMACMLCLHSTCSHVYPDLHSVCAGCGGGCARPPVCARAARTSRTSRTARRAVRPSSHHHSRTPNPFLQTRAGLVRSGARTCGSGGGGGGITSRGVGGWVYELALLVRCPSEGGSTYPLPPAAPGSPRHRTRDWTRAWRANPAPRTRESCAVSVRA